MNPVNKYTKEDLLDFVASGHYDIILNKFYIYKSLYEQNHQPEKDATNYILNPKRVSFKKIQLDNITDYFKIADLHTVMDVYGYRFNELRTIFIKHDLLGIISNGGPKYGYDQIVKTVILNLHSGLAKFDYEMILLQEFYRCYEDFSVSFDEVTDLAFEIFNWFLSHQSWPRIEFSSIVQDYEPSFTTLIISNDNKTIKK
jgi:hypothetical protein